MTTPTPGPLVRYAVAKSGIRSPAELLALLHARDCDYIYLADDADRVMEEILDTLEDYNKVLDCWMNTYAPELCDVELVVKAKQHIFDQGGTLAFIACQRKKAQRLLATLKGRTA